jgi:hypothetical protein
MSRPLKQDDRGVNIPGSDCLKEELLDLDKLSWLNASRISSISPRNITSFMNRFLAKIRELLKYPTSLFNQHIVHIHHRHKNAQE